MKKVLVFVILIFIFGSTSVSVSAVTLTNLFFNGDQYQFWGSFGGPYTVQADSTGLSIYQTADEDMVFYDNLHLVSNQAYTFIYEVTESNLDGDFAIFNSDDYYSRLFSSDTNVLNILPKSVGKHSVVLYTPSNLDANHLLFTLINSTNNEQGTYIKIKNMMLIPGNHVNEEIPYFVGSIEYVNNTDLTLIDIRDILAERLDILIFAVCILVGMEIARCFNFWKW